MNIRTDSFQALSDDASSLANAVAQGTDNAVRSAQEGLVHASEGLTVARHQSGAALKQFAQHTEALAHDGMEVVRERAQLLRDKSMHVKDATTTYIQHEPVKSVLIAAAVGATLMGLVALFSRHSGTHR